MAGVGLGCLSPGEPPAASCHLADVSLSQQSSRPQEAFCRALLLALLVGCLRRPLGPPPRHAAQPRCPLGRPRLGGEGLGQGPLGSGCGACGAEREGQRVFCLLRGPHEARVLRGHWPPPDGHLSFSLVFVVYQFDLRH